MALAVALAMMVPFASVAAAPGDNQPVGSVSWEGNITPAMGLGFHFSANLMVKKLSDGTIVGHQQSYDVTNHTKTWCIQFESAEFYPDGKTVVIVGLVQSDDPGWNGETRKERWTFVDNGEPGVANDLLNIEQLVEDFGESQFPYPGYDGVWKSWFFSADPIPLASGNIQVHDGD
jgi:hypothetical protein